MSDPILNDADFSDQLELFLGEASDALCRVYARLRGASQPNWRLAGCLRGPSCPYAHTLEATLPLVDRGPGSSLLAEAIVTEPSFWTPDMPHLYRADVELLDGQRVLARARRPLGLRTLGALGRKLLFDGKRWVLRGVLADEVPQTELAAWHEAGTAVVAHNPPDAVLAEASRLGVLVVAHVTSDETHEIRRLSQWPAVGMVVLSAAGTLDLHGWAHNLILAQRFAAGQAIRPAAWAQVAFCEVDDPAVLAQSIADCPTAAVAVRPAGSLQSVKLGRALCDQLQADLAGLAELAGYIV
jgi:Glycosyl hydrolases family 2